MEITLKWRDGQKWHDIDPGTVEHMSRTHALSLFSGKLAVIAKQDSEYFVNGEALRDQYRKQGRKVRLFSECAPSDRPLRDVGFG